ncbi:MAG TPA: alpha/beta hydrolase [Chloroflexota bacterium]|jgi:pimeloyl-ACP methyl ester carboxylesterase
MPFAQLSRVRLHYYERGHGPELVVLVHGFQMSGRVWQLVQQALPEDRYRTLAPDLRGAGESDAPPDEADYGIDVFAADVYELVMQLGLCDFTLVGHSMGGATGARFAVDHPELLKALVLVDPTDRDGRQAESAAEIDRLVEERMAARRAALARGDGDRELGIGGDGPHAEWFRQLAADVRAAPEQRLRGTMRSLFRLRLGEQVGRLPMPVLLACGDADQIIPLAQLLRTWARYPKGSGLHVWHGVGHSPNVELSERLAALLERFIAEATARRAGASVAR